MQTLTVIFQRGGHANYSWHKTIPWAGGDQYANASRQCDMLERAGYPAQVWRTDVLERDGLPTGFELTLAEAIG